MPAIEVNGRVLTLPADSQVAMERNSPLLSEEGETGSSTQAFQVPATDANNGALGFPARFDQRGGQLPPALDAVLLDDNGNGVTAGRLIFRGLEEGRYQYNLEFGDSAVMGKLKAKRIQTLRLGGARFCQVPGGQAAGLLDRQGVAAFMQHVATHWADFDFTFAPFSNNDHTGKWASYEETNKKFFAGQPGAPEFTGAPTANFNTWGFDLTSQAYGFTVPTAPFAVMGLPGVQLGTQALDSAIMCPLPKLEYVLRSLFAESQLPLETDVFDDVEAQRLVLVPVAGLIGYSQRAGSSWDDLVASFSLSEHLPDLTGAELVRKLMDTFGWHFDVTPGGTCRLLRAAPLVLDGDAVDLTSVAGSSFTIEQQEESSLLVQPQLPEGDSYAQEFGKQPEVASILAPVAAVQDLPAATAADQYRLVQAKRRYYKSEAKTVVTDTTGNGTASTSDDTTSTTTLVWKPGPFYLPAQQVGTSTNTSDYAPGVAAVLTAEVEFGLSARAEVLCFREPAFTTATATITLDQSSQPAGYVVQTTTTKSKTLRLAFYRGIQPVGGLDGAGLQPTIPWLTERHVLPSGTRVGTLSLEVHGTYGLAEQRLKPLLALRLAQTLIKMPVLLTAYQFGQLDFSRLVAVQGQQFMVRRLSLTLPVRQAGTMELVPRGQVATIQSRPVVSADFYTATGAAAPTCTLLIVDVQHVADVATVVVGQAQGQLKYQLDAGPLQDSNQFAGLVAGQKYRFWVYDLGVTGCHRYVERVW